MPDAHLRQLERRAAQGDLEAAGQLLVEQVRAGNLPEDRLQLLAHVGHPPARAARPAPAEQAERVDLAAWVRALERWPGAEPLAAVAAARPVLEVWEAWEPGELAPGHQLRTSLAACQGWALSSTSSAAREVALDELARAEQVMEELAHLLTTLDQEHRGVIRGTAWRALDCGWGVVTCLQAARYHLLAHAKRRSRIQDAGWAAQEASRALKRGPEPFQAAIRDALVPWALGSGSSGRVVR